MDQLHNTVHSSQTIMNQTVYDWLEASVNPSEWLETYLLVCMVTIKSISSKNGKIAKKSRKFGIEQK